MVALKEILANNTSINSSPTAVFTGATNGIGLATLIALTKHTTSPTIYIVGRSSARLQDLINKTLQPLNSSATFHPVIAADLTLISDSQKAAQKIIDSGVKKVDLLFMSQGFIDLKRVVSPEGVDRLTSIRYYSRFRILLTLLPLLRAAPSARVVSVLAGGQEGELWEDDWTMEKHWGLIAAGGAAASLTTLSFEQLAAQPDNKEISFIHVYPGLVSGTGLQIQGLSAVAGNYAAVPPSEEDRGKRTSFRSPKASRIGSCTT